MLPDEFIAEIIREGYSEPVLVEREANESRATHQHDFEAKALILKGEIRIRTEAGEHIYQRGDVFHLEACEEHCEFYGPQGVAYLSARKAMSEDDSLFIDRSW
ncbi:cupin [Enterobacterales bacterium CwR94]|nr:cupin [Enterobacterales bacterium CwR94]